MKHAGPIDSAILDHAALAAALDPIVTIDASGIILSVSKSVHRVLGWDPDELLGRSVNVLIPEPVHAAHDGYLADFRRTGQTQILNRPRRFEALHKDGSQVLVELCVSRADVPGRDSPLFVGILRDVSAAAAAEHTRDEERFRTQHQLTEQTTALRQAYERLRIADRMASLGTLAAGLGHDMNNVLLPVRARLNALRVARQRAGADGVRDLEQLAQIQRSVDYLQQLADGLHFLAMNPDSDDGAASPGASTDLQEWWTQTGVLLSKAVARGVQLDVRIEAGLPRVSIAAHGLTQAVLNLLVNASEAIQLSRPGDGGCITVSAQRSGGRESAFVCLTVADNGPGMSAEVQRRAFEMFFTTKPRGMGTGLGLPLVHRVADQAGGHVDLESTEGRGTAVKLVLPAATRRGTTSSHAEQAKAHLDISDGRVRAVVQQILEVAGAAVVPADDAPTADVWVIDPGRVTLATVRRWRSGRPSGALVIVGHPPKRTAKAWHALRPLLIRETNDLSAIRATIGRALHDNPGGTA